MSATAHLRDPLLPRTADGFSGAALISLATHGALIVALALGVQWRTQPVEVVVAAELWAAVPQSAAPATAPPPVLRPAPPPTLPPTPTPATEATKSTQPPTEPDAQIAIERRKLEREKARQLEQLAAQDRREKQAREERERLVAEARATKQREENLKRMLGQASSSASGTSNGTAAFDAAPSRSYAARLVAHIKPNIVFTDTLSGNPSAEVEVRVAASGSIVARRLQKSSGVKEWDEAVLRAIDRTGALPRDVDGRVPPVLIIGFRPND